MKKILYILLAVAVLTGCGEKPAPEKEKTLVEKIAGEWHCSASNIDADIFISFTADCKFELYQQVSTGTYRLYRGTWNIDESKMVMSGKYNDGEKWGSDYKVTLSDDTGSMTLVDSASHDYVYSRQEIPADVKEKCEIKVKSPYAY